MTRTLTSAEWEAIDADLFACRIQGAAIRVEDTGACELAEAFDVAQKRLVQLVAECPEKFSNLEPYRQLRWLSTAQ